MSKELKRFFGRIGSYMIVYIIMIVLVDTEIYTFRNIIFLALSYIVVDVTIILIRLDRKDDNNKD
jgi:hypothetical protein